MAGVTKTPKINHHPHTPRHYMALCVCSVTLCM